jgi:cell division protein FtsB
MPDEPEMTPQEQVKEGIWRMTLWSLVIAVSIGFGVFIGFQLWGDAPRLAKQVAGLEQQVADLKKEREGAAAIQAICERDKADAQKRFEKCVDEKAALQRQLGGGGQTN